MTVAQGGVRGISVFASGMMISGTVGTNSMTVASTAYLTGSLTAASGGVSMVSGGITVGSSFVIGGFATIATSGIQFSRGYFPAGFTVSGGAMYVANGLSVLSGGISVGSAVTVAQGGVRVIQNGVSVSADGVVADALSVIGGINMPASGGMTVSSGVLVSLGGLTVTGGVSVAGIMLVPAGVTVGAADMTAGALSVTGTVVAQSIEVSDTLNYNTAVVFSLSGANVALTTAYAGSQLSVFGGMRASGGFYVKGSVRFTSCVTQSGSDRRLKTNIIPIQHALKKVSNLNGVYFNWVSDSGTSVDLETKRQVGIIAQELERILPEVVHQQNEYLAVEYKALVPLVIEAIHELEDLAMQRVENKKASLEKIRLLILRLSTEMSDLNKRIDEIEKNARAD
jgi:hypothetical protein